MNSQQLLRAVENRLRSRWANDLVGPANSWPHRFPTGLGGLSKAELELGWANLHQPSVVRWFDWAKEHDAQLTLRPKRIWGVVQDIPTHVEIRSPEEAALLVGGKWPGRLAQGHQRVSRLAARFPDVDLAHPIKVVDSYSDVDFDLLLTVADWFRANPGAVDGLTPRMVPLPGIHAKWLQTHRAGVTALSGASIGDLIRHPARVHFTYLDPTHRASRQRLHDSATIGDPFEPAYRPDVVVISENKDTAIHFPEVPGGIAVEGVGKGGKTPAAFGWIRDAPTLVYWGDIDRDGYEILSGYRTDFDRDISSVLMDEVTYDTYKRFGTNQDRKGKPLLSGAPRDDLRLTTAERSVYEMLLDAEHLDHRRVEQERIPLRVALDAVRTLLADCDPTEKALHHSEILHDGQRH